MNIIAQLQGGLGNQLFQYATARVLAQKCHSPLLLDHSWFIKIYDDVTPRDLLLSSLNIQGTLISFEPPPQKLKRIRRILQQLWHTNLFIYSEKTPYHFDFHLLSAATYKARNLYLIGYWQSYRYFESIKKILQAEISPKLPLDAHYQNYLKQIQASTSAMVHIRRGDYVHLSSASKVHGFVGLQYYQKGMAVLLDKIPDITFFIFSDDLDWAKENLPHQERSIFIQSHESRDAVIQELELMTYCQHYLIANSSLSWWGAWLSKHENNSVICPKKWTNDECMNWDDLLPSHWQRI
jgi:hypothetical protein